MIDSSPAITCGSAPNWGNGPEVVARWLIDHALYLRGCGESDQMGLTPFRGHRLSGLGGRGDELVFKRYWADLAERAVPSPAVVDRLDP